MSKGHATLNLTSFLANKCFEYLLKCDSDEGSRNSRNFSWQKQNNTPTSHIIFFPPWAVDVKLFKKLCDGCGACVSSCENNILYIKKDGYPVVDFSKGACSFCGACAQNCPHGALYYDPVIPPWRLRASITGNCLMNNRVLCSTCFEQCDKGAITGPIVIHKDKVPEILAEKCDGCGACFGSCPVGAIAFKDNEHQTKP
jgi:ferredoxin-type protein NapF